MDFINMSIKEFLMHLSAKESVPGGGGASALAGAQGIALLMMVANYTIGNPKFAKFENCCKNVLAECENLLIILSNGIQADADAFKKVSEAYKNSSDNFALSSACIQAARVPLSAMEAADKGLIVADKLLGSSNPMLKSDIGDAVFNLDSCIKGAYLNVKVNLPMILDKGIKNDFIKRAGRILKDSKLMIDKFYKVFDV